MRDCWYIGIALVSMVGKTAASLVESSMLRGAPPGEPRMGVVSTTAAPVLNDTWEDQFPYPEYRYTEWSLLPTASVNAAQNSLSYNDTTWNIPFTNPLEGLWWGGLTPAQQAGANIIGFVDAEGEVWDCYQNHYNDYDWKELEEYGLDVPYITLGWTKKSWEGKDPEPASENKTWANLTLVEQEAADAVCYFLETWDMINMVNWTIDTTTIVPPTNLEVVTTLAATTSPVATSAPPATTTSDPGVTTSAI